MRRIAALLLGLVLLLSIPLAACADGESEAVVIATTEDFLRFAAACAEESYSADKRFVLTADIDLSNTDFAPVPYFAGAFDGGGHWITGVGVTRDGSRQGLFRTTGEAAVIERLNVRGSVTPGGTAVNVGGLVGENAGTVTECRFEGTVSGIENVGGVVGYNRYGGRIVDCQFEGGVSAEHQVGGIAGKNDGLLSGCTNRGEVNTDAIEPAGQPRFDISAFSEDDFLNLANIGGVAGENSGTLISCLNVGAVGYKYNGYNVGGVVGKSAGYVTDCANTASVTGRRDVGGIAGQLIPYAVWDLSDGKLDALVGELGGMQALLAELSRDASAMSGDVGRELSLLNGYTADALAALETVLRQYAENDQRIVDSISVDPETGEISFDDAYFRSADTSALSAALYNMEGEASVLAQLAAASVSVVAEDLTRVSNQMTAVFNSLSATVNNMGNILGETYDLSASETYSRDTGAIANCSNYGAVEAENHAGGIVGTVGFELDFDMEDRLDTSSFLTSNARQYLFAAVRNCGSYCAVGCKEEGAGIIAGAVDIGAIAGSVGLGEARSQNGDYVGGIVGQSAGSVSSCWSRAVLSGDKYVGGIAGLGHDLSACRSWAHIENAKEYAGSVAGWIDGTAADNLYVSDGAAGVDGVARTGQSTPVTRARMLNTPGVPQDFDKITVSFVGSDKTVEQVELPFGGSIDTLPAISNRGDSYWKWDDFDNSHIYYSQKVTGKYYAPNMTLSTGEDVPRFLVEGIFYEGQTLTVTPYSVGADAEAVISADTLRVNDYADALTVRMYAPEAVGLYRVRADGTQEKLDAERDGSYLVFRLENGGTVLSRAESTDGTGHLPLIIGAEAAAVLVAVWLILRERKKKAAAEPAEREENEYEKENL
ncbi:MAG: hypothetical protein IJV41_06760 [Oscillospiraceae bacterium]|nr:hypothetical protein [Oscillospiraceae bacterium]